MMHAQFHGHASSFFFKKNKKLRKDFRIPVSKRVENNKKNGWKTLNCNSQKW